MEADILRLILFLVGAAIIFGIYAFDRYKRNTQDEPTRDWTQHPLDERREHIEPRWDSIYGSDDAVDEEEEEDEDDSVFLGVDDPDAEEEDEDEDDLYSEDDEDEYDDVSGEMDEAIDSELEHLEEIIHEEHLHPPKHRIDSKPDMPKEQMSISFLTRDFRKEKPRDDEPELPTKIIQLNIVPHNGVFYGDDIQFVAHEVGLEPGDMHIFHSYGDDPNKPHPVFSMASMVEPGTFPVDDMDNFSTPGLTLFTQLPGPKDGLTVFTEMLHAAEQLANKLEGELRDESHSALTKQTISHMREDIQEYHRQIQLVRSKR